MVSGRLAAPRLAARARGPLLGIAGQVLNAATNVATVYVASFLLDPGAFGAFVLAFAVVTVVLGAGRGLIGTVMQIQLPAVDDVGRAALVRSAIGFTLVVGILGAVGLALFGDGALRVFAPWVVGALVQDAARYAYLSVGRQGPALALDVLWATVQVTVVVLFSIAGEPMTVAALAVAWGLGGLAGALLFVVPRAGRPAAPAPWIRTTRDVAGWFTGIAMIAQVELLAVLWVTDRLLGPVEAGGLRAVQLLAYQPVIVLLGALSVVSMPAVVRAASSRARLGRAWVGAAAAIAPVVLLLLVVLALRDPLMALLFPRYVDFTALVVPLTLQAVLSAVAVPSTLVQRALRRGAAAFVLQALRVGLVVGGATLGTLAAGPDGVAWGMAAGTAVAVALITAQAGLAVSRVGEPVADRPASVPGEPPALDHVVEDRRD